MQHGGFELVAVCDTLKERLQDAKDACACATYTQFSKILADPAIELMIIATPSKFHEPMAIKALNAGKHVLVEKPSARTVGGIDRMIAAAQKSGKVLTMHHNYRVNDDYQYVKQVIDSGILGDVFRIGRFVGGFSRRNDWQTLKKYGGGMVGNWGVHLVDHCLLLLDSPLKDVWGHVRHVFNPGDAEDDIKAVLRAESGMVIDIEMTTVNAAPIPNWTVLGNHGSMWILNNKAHLHYFDPKKLPALEPNDHPYALNRAYGVIPGPDEVPWVDKEEEPKPKKKPQAFYDNLRDAIRKGAPLIVEPESARLTYKVLDRIRRGSGF